MLFPNLTHHLVKIAAAGGLLTCLIIINSAVLWALRILSYFCCCCYCWWWCFCVAVLIWQTNDVHMIWVCVSVSDLVASFFFNTDIKVVTYFNKWGRNKKKKHQHRESLGWPVDWLLDRLTIDGFSLHSRTNKWPVGWQAI